jgi:hypothetical protein
MDFDLPWSLLAVAGWGAVYVAVWQRVRSRRRAKRARQ